MVSDRKKKFGCHDSGQKHKTFFYSCQHDLLVQRRYLIIVFYFISILVSLVSLVSLQFWCQKEFVVHFLAFSHKISKVLKLSVINKYHLTWGIYASHSFLKIKNLIGFRGHSHIESSHSLHQIDASVYGWV